MNITEVRIKLMDEQGERLKAFCSITFDDCFVIRDLKIIEGTSGPFVAMPSRKLTAHCPGCGMKNHLRSNYCNQCGRQLDSNQAIRNADGRAKLYADIAHPINSDCREQIQAKVIAEYDEELIRSKQPGYVSRYDDFDDDHHNAPKKTMRVDCAHTAPNNGGQTSPPEPHTPPQSTPSQESSGGPHSPPSGSASQQSNPGGFGAGILGDD